MPNLPSFRFPGDGFDFRTPVPTSTDTSPSIIDLTDDSSPDNVQPQPRLHTRLTSSSSVPRPAQTRQSFRNVVDLDEETTRATVDNTRQSPDFELLEVRSIRSQSASNGEQRRRQEVRHPESNLRPPGSSNTQNHPFAVRSVGGWGALRQHAQGRERHQQLAQQSARHFHHLLHSNHPHPTAEMLLRHEGRDIILPGELDFVTQGFRMGGDAGPQPTRASLPTYDPPSPPRPGFVRSLREDDVLVCPNCEGELGLGEDDVKRQVWVVKACGHRYGIGMNMYE
ncbi:MAG: hypothetical protein Q9170_003249 [Blastenia crenularia]